MGGPGGRPGLSGSEERARAAVSSVGTVGPTQFLQVQLSGHRERPSPLPCQPLASEPLALPPPLPPPSLPPTPSPLGFHRHLRGRLRGSWEAAVQSAQRQWEDCRWADVTSPCWAQLILLQGGTLTTRNKHPLCWGQTRRDPLRGQNLWRLGPVLGAHTPAEGQGTKTWWPRRLEPSDVRLPPSCLPPPGLEYFCQSCPLTTFDPFIPAKLWAGIGGCWGTCLF